MSYYDHTSWMALRLGPWKKHPHRQPDPVATAINEQRADWPRSALLSQLSAFSLQRLVKRSCQALRSVTGLRQLLVKGLALRS